METNYSDYIGKYYRLCMNTADNGVMDIILHIIGVENKTIEYSGKKMDLSFFKVDEIHAECAPNIKRDDLDNGSSFNIAEFHRNSVISSSLVKSIENDGYIEVSKTLYDKYKLIYEETKEMQHALLMLHDM